MRMALAAVVLSLVVIGLSALVDAQKPDPGKETPKLMSELDALKIGKLFAERQTLEQALLKLQAQQESLRAQTQLTRAEYGAIDMALGTAVLAAAKEVGLTADDLKAGWQPNPEERRWVKRELKD